MKRKSTISQRIIFGVFLIGLSAFFYVLHFAIFRDYHHIFIYMVGDIAFVFFEVLLVTLIIHQILSEREKRALLNKLNMVVGAFFSEVGTGLLKHFEKFDTGRDKLNKELIVGNDWSGEHFDLIHEQLEKHKYRINSRAGDLEALRELLVSKRGFLIRLLENPNLLEYESFTELLWAVFHLEEELSHRKSFSDLPDSDYEHLAGDITRAYRLLVREWLCHMEHLKDNYPYLFSLSIRTNPFDPSARVEVS